MKLNRLECAGIFAALSLIALASIFAVSQAVTYADDSVPVDPCSDIFPHIPGMPSCDESGGGSDDGNGNQTPVDPCDIMPDPAHCDDDTDNGGGNGGGEEETDVCPNDEGVQATTPCPSDENTEGGGGGGGSDNGGGESSGGSGSGGGGGSGGSVLGATTGGGNACDYLTSFVKPGAQNDPEQVLKLQSFLKIFEGADVEINGTYDAASISAVHAFQTKYSADILMPWGISKSTGFVYLTTRKKVNEIYCDRGMQFPLTEEQQRIIDMSKARATEVTVPARPTVRESVEVPEREQEAKTPIEESPVVDQPGSSFMNFFRRLIDRLR